MRPTRYPGSHGNCANAFLTTVMWSAAVFEPALPARSSIATGSPVPSPPWSTNAHNGWNPKPRLKVGAACSFSECAVTRVASRSMISGWYSSMSSSGARSPAADHAAVRTAARAVSIADRAISASAARVAIKRDTVGSEATGPNTSGCARNWAMSARQSPPSANATARSSTILPGSWRDNGFRQGDRATDRASVNPVFSAVRNNRTEPACDTTPVPVADADRRGYGDVDLPT